MLWRTAVALWLALLLALPAGAGQLDRNDIARRVLPPLYLGERTDDLPVWPIHNRLEPDAGSVGYVFETIDFAPLPGFEGTPINLLVWLDRHARFVTVDVVSQHEPVFVSGFGPGPLEAFVRQYAGHDLRHRFTVTSAYGRRTTAGSGQVVLDGVTRATASVRIVNQTVIDAALAVARARLGFAAPAHADRIAEVRSDVFERLDLAALIDGGHLARRVLRNAEVEALFADGAGARLDPQALVHPDEVFVEVWIAYLNAPTIGRSLLGDDGYARAMRRARDGEHLYWIASSGRLDLVDDNFVPGTVPPRLLLAQREVNMELRDGDVDLPHPPPIPGLRQARVFAVAAGAGLDPASPLSLSLLAVRTRGQIFSETIEREIRLDYEPPQPLFLYPPRPLPQWLAGWRDRGGDLAAIGAALLLLTIVLARPRFIAVDPRRLRGFRIAFLGFTLIFVGWHAQAQLSIVHLTGAVKALAAGHGLMSYLYDPVVLLLIAYTAVTLFVWGRGPFCGWLCPFGALQEFVAILARHLDIRRRRLPGSLARALSRGRFVVLAALGLLAAIAPRAADVAVEIEPFKTAITTSFLRTWPFVAYGIALLVAGAFVPRLFCRFLCPLGALLTLGGRMRRLDWLSRREQCGRPCQSCRNRCEYDAIARNGAIRYDDCYQCLDCVGIYHDVRRCVPMRRDRQAERREA